jgi:cobalamin biosynthesis protein CobT
MKISKKNLKRLIENFLFEQEEEPAEEPAEESEEEPAEESEDELEDSPFAENPDEEASEEEASEEESGEEEPAEESGEESQPEQEEDPLQKMEKSLTGKTPKQAKAAIIGKFIAGDSFVLPSIIKKLLAKVAPPDMAREIENDETEYNEDTFTKKYGSLLEFI